MAHVPVFLHGKMAIIKRLFVVKCRAVLTSDSDPIEVWLVTNNDPVQKPEAETADRLQLPLPPQPPEQPAQVALADSPPCTLQTSPPAFLSA